MKFLSLLVILFAFTACQHEPSTSGAQPVEEQQSKDHSIALSKEQMEQAGIELGQPQQRSIGEYLSCSGQVDVPPAGRHAVHSPVMGFVGEIKHLPGQYVKRGTALTSIHHPDLIRLQRDYMETAARLPFLEKDVARKATLADADAASQKVYEAVASELAVAQSRLQGLRAELELIGIDVDRLTEKQQVQKRIYLYAPTSGYLADVLAQPGQLVQPASPLFSMIDNSHLHLELEVYAKDLPKVKAGQPVRIQMPGGDKILAGKVHLIGKSVDLEQKTARVHVHFEEEPGDMAIGAFLFAQIQVNSRMATVVPEAAVVRSGDQAFVFQQTTEGFKRVSVQLGQEDEGYFEILAPSIVGQSPIALQGAYYIHGTE